MQGSDDDDDTDDEVSLLLTELEVLMKDVDRDGMLARTPPTESMVA